MPSPNPAQQELIDGIDGCYLVDAGPGTGKTFTITRRYGAIVDQAGIGPDDILLITFTRNAATEMRDRIVATTAYPARTLADAPIQTFHALCHDILRSGGYDAPRHLGLDDTVTPSTRLLEDQAIEADRFRAFMAQFADRHPEHASSLATVRDPIELLSLINTLAAKGAIPMAEGWYRGSERHLLGDHAEFASVFAARNEPRNDGNAQSRLRARLTRYGNDGCYRANAPPKETIRGEGTKRVPTAVCDLAFEENRSALIDFVHDVYFEYLAFALARNYLNFGMLQVLAFVHLCEHDRFREQLSFEYVMIDEFQDTSEIQFKLALLLSNTANLCVVGDWKQSIYSFQYAAVENITAFADRLARFIDALNEDRPRVQQTFDPIYTIDLERNYRSTQSIVDVAEHALTVPGSQTDAVDVEQVRAEVVSLDAVTDHTHSRIEAIQHPEEQAAILTKIGEMVDNETYAVRGSDGSVRPPTYGDIAVLTRTRAFGRELLAQGERHGFPMAFEGEIELFRTDPAKLTLAWLRILEGAGDRDRGWAVVLERAGYRMDEINAMLERSTYPDDMLDFRAGLDGLDTVGAITQRVCRHYGFTGTTADQVRATLQSIHDGSTMTRGGLIRYLERGIENGVTRAVTTAAGENAVKVKTIHATKGLEYPIVMMSNMNRQQFPTHGSGTGSIVYGEGFGLRQRRVLADDHGSPHLYSNWRWDILKHCRPNPYDEERRLLYVAITRARDHVVLTAGESPSRFFQAFPVEATTYEPDVGRPRPPETVQTRLEVSIPTPEGPIGRAPHDVMDTAVFEDVEGGRGPAYGTRVHAFAEAYALGEQSRAPANPDERHVAAFIDSLPGDLHVEQEVTLPLSLDGRRITMHGYVDLVHVTEDAVDVIDYKTDVDAYGVEEYRKQLSIYYHVLDAVFPERTVSATLFYTHQNREQPIEPQPIEEIEALMRAGGGRAGFNDG